MMVDFDHLGYELNCCGGFLDGIQNCIQTCLHHTVGSLDRLIIIINIFQSINQNNCFVCCCQGGLKGHLHILTSFW